MRSHVIVIGVALGVALLPYAFHLIQSWLGFTEDKSARDHDRDEDDDQDDDGDGGGSLNHYDVAPTGDRDAQELHGDANGYDDNVHFFSMWLDPYMLLSSARFHDDDNDLDLTMAQRQMMDEIAVRLELREGMHVLVVECGWGELALYLVRFYGVRVTGYSRHAARVAAALDRAQAADVGPHIAHFLHGKVTDKSGTFDRIIRIDLLETETPVPEELYASLLAEGGKALVHRATQPLASPIVFPPFEDSTRFAIVSEDISPSFARTVRFWSANLATHKHQGNLRGFETSTCQWQNHLARLSTEVENGVRGLEQVVYTKLPPPPAIDRRGVVRRRDGRVVVHSNSAPATI